MSCGRAGCCGWSASEFRDAGTTTAASITSPSATARAAFFVRRMFRSRRANPDGSATRPARIADRRAMLKCRQPRRFSGIPLRRHIRWSAPVKAATRCTQNPNGATRGAAGASPCGPCGRSVVAAPDPASGGEQPAGQTVARTAYRSASSSHRRDTYPKPNQNSDTAVINVAMAGTASADIGHPMSEIAAAQESGKRPPAATPAVIPAAITPRASAIKRAVWRNFA
jgi:hypothetical protein